MLHLPPPGRPRWVCPDAARLELLYLAWGYRHYGRHPIPISRHEGWHYVLVVKGTPILQLNDKTVPLEVGDFIVIDPECASGWTDREQERAELLVWLWRNPPQCPEISPEKGSVFQWRVTEPIQSEMRQIHSECRNEVERPDAWTRMALQQLRMRVDVLLVRALNVKERKPPAELRFELALRWLQQHLQTRNPVASLSDYLQISASSINRMFVANFGISPQVYHQRLRMEHACRLFEEQQMTVKEVAYQMGYRHPNDFSRAFKKLMGKSPKTRCLK